MASGHWLSTELTVYKKQASISVLKAREVTI